MERVLLGLHLSGALLTGYVALRATWLLARRRPFGVYRPAGFLAGMTLYQVATGVLLASLTHSGTAGSFCARIALYVAAIFLLEVALLHRAYVSGQSFPFAAVKRSLAGSSLGALAFAIIFF